MKTCAICKAPAEDAERVCSQCGAPFTEESVRESARVVQLRERREQDETRRYWQAQRRRSQARRRQETVGGIWREAPVTIVLLSLTVLVSLFGGFGLALLGLGPLRYVMLLFYNPGILSLVLSGVFLWVIGSQFEREVPLALYLIVFFGSGLAGGAVEAALGSLPVGLFPALWGMAGGLWSWSRGHRMSPYTLQWIYGAIISTVVLNLFLLNFNIGPLVVQIVAAIAVGAALVYLWDRALGTRARR